MAPRKTRSASKPADIQKKTKTFRSNSEPQTNFKVLKDAVKGADNSVIEQHAAVTSQVLMRGAASAIKKLGSHPIALVAKHSVKKGIPLRISNGGVSKKKANDRINAQKSINIEIARSAGSTPSQLKLKKELLATRIQMNTELIKRALLKELKGAKPSLKSTKGFKSPKRAMSPVKGPTKSPKMIQSHLGPTVAKSGKNASPAK